MASDFQNPAETDAQLLENLSLGDTESFWHLWERYGADLYRCCCRWMRGNQADAEDVFGNAMLKAWRKLPEYASEIINAKGWLMRLTFNLCMDMQRARQRRANDVEDIEEMSYAFLDRLLQNSANPARVYLDREMKEYIYCAIAALPFRLREPVILRFVQEMSYRDIAERLGLSNANVRKRIQQARGLLQTWLRGYVSEGKRPHIKASDAREIHKYAIKNVY